MTDIIDKDATVIGDTQRAMFALIEENKALRSLLADCKCCGAACDCGHPIDTHDDSGCVLGGCDCRKWEPETTV
jgi:hypothetical protein